MILIGIVLNGGGQVLFGLLQPHILQSSPSLEAEAGFQSQILPVYSSRNPSLLARALCRYAKDFC